MRSKGESRDKRMIRICLPVANQINKDLDFIAEAAVEFENQRLPTLDFELWLGGDQMKTSFSNGTAAKTLHPLKRSHQKEAAVYRNARSTLASRCKKKLIEKTGWYKKKQKRTEEEDRAEKGQDRKRSRGEKKKHKIKIETENSTF